jgi:hypothetical protein
MPSRKSEIIRALFAVYFGATYRDGVFLRQQG